MKTITIHLKSTYYIERRERCFRHLEPHKPATLCGIPSGLWTSPEYTGHYMFEVQDTIAGVVDCDACIFAHMKRLL